MARYELIASSSPPAGVRGVYGVEETEHRVNRIIQLNMHRDILLARSFVRWFKSWLVSKTRASKLCVCRTDSRARY